MEINSDWLDRIEKANDVLIDNKIEDHREVLKQMAHIFMKKVEGQYDQKECLKRCEYLLLAYDVEDLDEAQAILQALGYVLFGVEFYPEKEKKDEIK